MRCTYDYNGQTYYNDQELDNAIAQDYIQGQQVSYPIYSASVDRVQTTTTAIKNIHDSFVAAYGKIHLVTNTSEGDDVKVDDEGDIDYYYDFVTHRKEHQTSGVTRFTHTFGPPRNIETPFNTGINMNNYWNTEKTNLLDNVFNGDENLFNNYKTLVEDSWQYLTDYGTEIHAIYEDAIKSIVENKTVTEAYDSTSKYLSDDIVKQVKLQAADFIQALRNKYGENCVFLAEVPILSKVMHGIYKSDNNDSVTSLNGRADLIVVDENGRAHVIDYKVSRRDVGTWDETNNSQISQNEWPSTKKRKTALQLRMYTQILNQYGITVGSPLVAPIKLNITNYVKDKDKVFKDILNLAKRVTNGDVTQNEATQLLSDIMSIDSVGTFDNTTNTDSGDVDNHLIAITNPSKQDVSNIIQVLPNTLELGTNLIEGIREPMQKFFPGYEISTKTKNREVTLDYYEQNRVKEISETDPKRKYGKYMFRNHYKSANKQFVYAETKEEMRVKLQEYVDEINKERENEMLNLANSIRGIELNANDEEDSSTRMDALEVIGHQTTIDYTKLHLKKYIINNWKLESTDELVAAGIFIFSKDGTLEILSINDKPTNASINGKTVLPRGKSLLGKTHRDYEIDSHEILPATNGNVDLIKIMCLLNHNFDSYQEYKINRVVSINIWEKTAAEEFNEKVFDNFERLCTINKNELKLSRDNFSSVVEKAFLIANDMSDPKIKGFMGGFSQDVNDKYEAITIIERTISKLESQRGEDFSAFRSALNTQNWDFNDPIQSVYLWLQYSLNELKGNTVYREADPSKFFKFSGGLELGTHITSVANSPSQSLQNLDRIMSIANTKIREGVLSDTASISTKLKNWREKNGYNALLGNQVSIYRRLFESTDTGKISGDFKLKNLKDPTLLPGDREIIETILDYVNIKRYNGDMHKVMELKQTDNPVYYEMPLSRASLNSAIINGGVKQAIVTNYNEATNIINVFAEQEEDFQKSNKKTYNKYAINAHTREVILNNNDITFFETDLETLLFDYSQTYLTELFYKQAVPAIAGVKMALQFNNIVYGQVTENAEKFIDDYLDANIFKKQIMDPDLQPAYRFLSAAKDISTMLTLGFNLRTGVREFAQGAWTHISRVMADMYGSDQFNGKDMAKAWQIIALDAGKRISDLSMVESLNLAYGMANTDNVAERIKRAKTGLGNFDSGTMYMAAGVADIYNRLGFLIARMVHVGCYEAHSVDSNGNLVYDFTKDERFSLIHKPGVNKNSLEYKKQFALYISMIEQFNTEGYTDEDGNQLTINSKLPRAFTVQESTSIKAFAEMCFGHYDKTTQMMAKKLFLGSMFMHLRTFLSAKMEQWAMTPGTYNQGKYTEKVNDDGVKYVRIFTETTNGLTYRIGLETEVQDGEYSVPLVDWSDKYIEGIAFTMIDFGKTILKMDWNEAQELWKNPTKRSNLLAFIWDMMFMSLIGWLLMAWMDSKDEISIPEKFFLSAIQQSTEDFNFLKIMSSLGGDWNPPTWSVITRVVENGMNFVTGKTNASDLIMNTFGALTVFKN